MSQNKSIFYVYFNIKYLFANYVQYAVYNYLCMNMSFLHIHNTKSQFPY